MAPTLRLRGNRNSSQPQNGETETTTETLNRPVELSPVEPVAAGEGLVQFNQNSRPRPTGGISVSKGRVSKSKSQTKVLTPQRRSIIVEFLLQPELNIRIHGPIGGAQWRNELIRVIEQAPKRGRPSTVPITNMDLDTWFEDEEVKKHLDYLKTIEGLLVKDNLLDQFAAPQQPDPIPVPVDKIPSSTHGATSTSTDTRSQPSSSSSSTLERPVVARDVPSEPFQAVGVKKDDNDERLDTPMEVEPSQPQAAASPVVEISDGEMQRLVKEFEEQKKQNHFGPRAAVQKMQAQSLEMIQTFRSIAGMGYPNNSNMDILCHQLQSLHGILCNVVGNQFKD